MHSTRRTILLGGLAQLASAAKGHNLRAGRAEAKLSPAGGLDELRYEKTQLVSKELGDGCVELSIAGKPFRCDRPVSSRRTRDGVRFEYRVEHLDVTYDVGLRELADGAVLTQTVLFPNLRNTLWSCNWYHQTTWDRNEKTVATYGIPVAVSNGYGDDTGPSDMNTEQTERMMALFSGLGGRKLELDWIEQTGSGKTYKGRPVPEA